MAKVRVRVLKRKVYEWKSVQSPCKRSDANIYVCVRACVCSRLVLQVPGQ